MADGKELEKLNKYLIGVTDPQSQQSVWMNKVILFGF